MASDRFTQLTPRERDCLGLVAQGLSSKEIALRLEISPYTVDEYIRTAVGKLGAGNRREAARLYAVRPEAGQVPPQSFGDEAQAVAAAPDSVPTMHPVRSGESPSWWLSPLRSGRRYNDLTVFQRLVWIALGAVAMVILVSQLSQGMQAIQSIFHGR
jgi:DNA-binding CsgD family transcriptional regulator